MKNEQKFYSALENIFIGEAGQKIEGKSGYVNLMKLKSQYFAQIKPFIEKEVNETFGHETASREEAFQKLFTFFESYLNETGTPYFSQTPFHKNLYEKVYSERDDVALFWKTQRLYYVKSEANYHSLQNLEVDGLTFNFDASQIEHQKNNEKKSLEFWATQLTDDAISFKVVYQDNTKAKWDRLKEYLELSTPDEIRKHLIENFGSKDNPNIVYKDNGLSREGLKAKQLQSAILITNNNDLTKTVTVEFALSNLEDLDIWAKHNQIINLTVRETTIKKAQQLYKKQNEVDYFIHKDAEGFLNDQFDIFLYQYLFGDRHLGNEWTQNRIDTIQKLKRIAHKIINYISRFEDELKHIWEKKKIIKETNYVFTIDRLFPLIKKGDRDYSDKNAIALLEKIIAHKGFDSQIKEYVSLSENWTNDEGVEIKKVWKEFAFSNVFKKSDVILVDKKSKTLNTKFQFLPIDTNFFHDIKIEILQHFDNLENIIDGTLIKSDNWQGLNLISKRYNDTFGLVYIDPPFNTGSDFAYKDAYQNSTWLTLMQNRLDIAYDLLNTKGSFYLHLDENANHFGRLIMDRVFGQENFKREIIWNIAVLAGFKVKGAESNWILGHQSIYFYTKNNTYDFNKLMQGHSQKYIDMFTGEDPDGRKYLIAHKRKRYLDEVIDKGKPFGDVWADLKDLIEDDESTFKEVWESLKERIDNGRDVSTVWSDIMSFQQQPTASERILFDTQKPEKLLERIVKASIVKNKFVLDYYGGSGTTAATCQKIGIKYVTMEMGEHFNLHIIPRLKRTLIGHQTNVAKDNEYKGGGMFRYYNLEQYEESIYNASYNPKWLDKDGKIEELEQVAYYTFKHSNKQLDAMVIDEEKEEVKIHFQNLYPEMDEAAIAETISNVSGKAIKTISKEKVVFTDDTFIEFANMRYDDPIFKDHYRSLLWWKSKE
jgi:adenine-specific DNA-methyltransferase